MIFDCFILKVNRSQRQAHSVLNLIRIVALDHLPWSYEAPSRWFDHFPFAFGPAWRAQPGRVRRSGLLQILFKRCSIWGNARPIDPNSTKQAPATIDQCGNCIAEPPWQSLTSSPSALARPSGGWLRNDLASRPDAQSTRRLTAFRTQSTAGLDLETWLFEPLLLRLQRMR